MPGEHDDFDDAKMSELLGGWGRQVCGEASGSEPGRAPPPAAGRLFEPPADLSALHRALDAVDSDLARRALRRRRKLAVRWIGSGLAAAACLAVVVGGWWYSKQLYHPGVRPTTLALADIDVSMSPSRVRGDSRHQFASGDQLYIHFVLREPGGVAVAMLDSAMQFTLVHTAESLPAGPNTVGPFELDDKTGTESFVMIARPKRFDETDARKLISQVGAEIPSTAGTHAQKLQAIREAIERRTGNPSGDYTFEHLPP